MTARARSPKVLEGEVSDVETVEAQDEAPQLRQLGGIEVLMRKPNDAQVAMLIRLAKATEKDPEKNFARLADVFFRIIEGLLVDEDDIEVLLEEIVTGRITMAQISAGLTPKDEDAKTPGRRTRRVR